ncbi:c-type cytochrome [Gynuella sunshinyii]|uniref:Cytochrome c553 n=1 Tax=Gynuella sunshinyii YC6258 TaxID=1445510 RepID=A0A0C5VF63_9GAMM|nr:c-type cytochrome [Gynuella sunshinyii]AJQ92786.1 cytochrome c553 [Gynuella sunshinyii YC6258]
MKKQLISFLFLSLVLSGAASAAGDIEAGKALSQSATCIACHGPDGIAAIPNYPSLAGQGEAYLLKQLRDVKSGARVINEMAAIVAPLSDQDLQDLSAFFSSLNGPSGQADPKQVKLGQSLFMGGNIDTGVTACAACHTPTGMGNPVAAFPRLAGQNPAYIVAQLKKFREGYRHTGALVAEVRTNDGESKMMRDVAFRLKDFEIDALASYISGLY